MPLTADSFFSSRSTYSTFIPLLDLFNVRTLLTYYIIILILNPHYTYTDKITNRSNHIQKRFQEDLLDYPVPTQPASGCSSCRMRDEVKQRNIEVLKGEILRRMGFDQPPNITGKVLPQIPQHYLTMVDPDYGMQSDQPMSTPDMGINDQDDEEEFRVRTEKILTFAQPCKCFSKCTLQIILPLFLNYRLNNRERNERIDFIRYD